MNTPLSPRLRQLLKLTNTRHALYQHVLDGFSWEPVITPENQPPKAETASPQDWEALGFMLYLLLLYYDEMALWEEFFPNLSQPQQLLAQETAFWPQQADTLHTIQAVLGRRLDERQSRGEPLSRLPWQQVFPDKPLSASHTRMGQAFGVLLMAGSLALGLFIAWPLFLIGLLGAAMFAFHSLKHSSSPPPPPVTPSAPPEADQQTQAVVPYMAPSPPEAAPVAAPPADAPPYRLQFSPQGVTAQPRSRWNRWQTLLPSVSARYRSLETAAHAVWEALQSEALPDDTPERIQRLTAVLWAYPEVTQLDLRPWTNWEPPAMGAWVTLLAQLITYHAPIQQAALPEHLAHHPAFMALTQKIHLQYTAYHALRSGEMLPENVLLSLQQTGDTVLEWHQKTKNQLLRVPRLFNTYRPYLAQLNLLNAAQDHWRLAVHTFAQLPAHASSYHALTLCGDSNNSEAARLWETGRTLLARYEALTHTPEWPQRTRAEQLQDYCRLLDIPSTDQLRPSLRQLLLRWHPDKGLLPQLVGLPLTNGDSVTPEHALLLLNDITQILQSIWHVEKSVADYPEHAQYTDEEARIDALFQAARDTMAANFRQLHQKLDTWRHERNAKFAEIHQTYAEIHQTYAEIHQNYAEIHQIHEENIATYGRIIQDREKNIATYGRIIQDRKENIAAYDRIIADCDRLIESLEGTEEKPGLRAQIADMQSQVDNLTQLTTLVPQLQALLPHLQALQPAQAETKAAETQPSIETAATQATPDEPDASASASPNFFGHR